LEYVASIRAASTPAREDSSVTQRVRSPRSLRRPAVPATLAHRLPPGQFVTPRWPVLHKGEIPSFDPATWDFRVWGAIATPRAWDWAEFQQLPTVTVAGDLHCVTRWSSLDHEWRGVSGRTIADLARLESGARYILLHGEGGYTANLPLSVFIADDVVLATHHAGEPLTAEHGAPLRAVVPGRYAWKSIKWLRGVEFLAEDVPGFWERYGYSASGDPWREERFES
jgi:DMSO/TMAO reductase YedYZ molybdopterin-dependent catalytic subunit